MFLTPEQTSHLKFISWNETIPTGMFELLLLVECKQASRHVHKSPESMVFVLLLQSTSVGGRAADAVQKCPGLGRER